MAIGHLIPSNKSLDLSINIKKPISVVIEESTCFCFIYVCNPNNAVVIVDGGASIAIHKR